MIETFGYGRAIELMRTGHKVAREGWNGKGMFAFYEPAVTVESKPHEMDDFGPYKYYRARLMLKTAQDDIATWSASGSDQLATDWFIYQGTEREEV